MEKSNIKLSANLHLVESIDVSLEGKNIKYHHKEFSNYEMINRIFEINSYIFGKGKKTLLNVFCETHFKSKEDKFKFKRMVVKNLEINTDFKAVQKDGILFSIEVIDTIKYAQFLSAFKIFLDNRLGDMIKTKIVTLKKKDKKIIEEKNELLYEMLKNFCMYQLDEDIEAVMNMEVNKKSNYYSLDEYTLNRLFYDFIYYISNLEFKNLKVDDNFTFIYGKENEFYTFMKRYFEFIYKEGLN